MYVIHGPTQAGSYFFLKEGPMGSTRRGGTSIHKTDSATCCFLNFQGLERWDFCEGRTRLTALFTSKSSRIRGEKPADVLLSVGLNIHVCITLFWQEIENTDCDLSDWGVATGTWEFQLTESSAAEGFPLWIYPLMTGASPHLTDSLSALCFNRIFFILWINASPL